MQILKCTGKLQKEMGLKKKDLVATCDETVVLGAWHANLIFIDRRKCVLFVNDKTLFNFLVPDVSRQHIRDLPELFKNFLKCVLIEEDIKGSVVDKILNEYDEILFAKTDSKKVLGSMNDLAFHYKHRILDEGSIHTHMIPQIIKALNRMPMGTIDYNCPVKLLQDVCEGTI